MDQNMKIVQDMVAVDASFSDDFDPDYEFDANRFFDFLKVETRSDAEQAESWFRYAREYPPSPFLVKLKLMKAAKINTVKAQITSSGKTEANKININSDIDHKAASREMKIKDVKHHNHIPQDNLKATPKSTVNLSKPSGSSFMKPTASHLAKQNIEFDIHSGGYGRLQKPVVSAVEKLRSPIRIQNQTTKRQKLEIGYLRKAAQLKHRATFVHKVSKKAGADQPESSSNSRAKTTLPKKPALAMKERAQSCMSQNKSESLQRPLNRKVLGAPKFAQHKKNMFQSNEFQVLHKKISTYPVNEDMLVDVKRQSFGNAKKDKCRSPNNLKSCTAAKVHPIKDGGFELNSKQNSLQPPTELFKKLSLKSEPETKVKQPHLTKGLKENVAGSYQQEFRRCGRKPNHYGTDTRIAEVKI